MRNSKIVLATFALAAVSACANTLTQPHPTTLALPATAREVVPPPAYARWWDQVQECSGKTRDFQSVRWYRVPGVTTFTVNGVSLFAMYNPDLHAIVLAEGAEDALGFLERHEMLHAIRRDNGYTIHDATDFGINCRSLITPAEVDKEGTGVGHTNGKQQVR